MSQGGSILFTWFVIILSISVFAMVYFVLFGPVFYIYNFSMAGLPAQGQATMNIYINSFLWSGLIFLLGMIGYGFLWARRKEYDVTSGQ